MGIKKEEKGGRVLCNTSQRGKRRMLVPLHICNEIVEGPSVGKVLEAYAPLLLHKHYYRISDFPKKKKYHRRTQTLGGKQSILSREVDLLPNDQNIYVVVVD